MPSISFFVYLMALLNHGERCYSTCGEVHEVSNRRGKKKNGDCCEDEENTTCSPTYAESVGHTRLYRHMV